MNQPGIRALSTQEWLAFWSAGIAGWCVFLLLGYLLYRAGRVPNWVRGFAWLYLAVSGLWGTYILVGAAENAMRVTASNASFPRLVLGFLTALLTLPYSLAWLLSGYD